MAVQNPSTCQGLWHCGMFCYTVSRVLFGNNFSDILDEASLAQQAQSSLSEPDMHLLLSPGVPAVSQSHVVVFNDFVSCLQSFCLAFPKKDSFAMSMLMAPGM